MGHMTKIIEGLLSNLKLFAGRARLAPGEFEDLMSCC